MSPKAFDRLVPPLNTMCASSTGSATLRSSSVIQKSFSTNSIGRPRASLAWPTRPNRSVGDSMSRAIVTGERWRPQARAARGS